MTRATASAIGESITVHIPMTFRKRGGRKLVVTPDGAEWAPPPRIDNAMVKGLARAFRWRKMLDTVAHVTLDELARARGVAPAAAAGGDGAGRSVDRVPVGMGGAAGRARRSLLR